MDKTDEEIYQFCKAHYYSNVGTADECLWQPFENWNNDDVEDLIQNDVDALREFLKTLKTKGETI